MILTPQTVLLLENVGKLTFLAVAALCPSHSIKNQYIKNQLNMFTKSVLTPCHTNVLCFTNCIFCRKK